MKIDTAIPIPAHHTKKWKYPFHSMKVGESFIIEKAVSTNSVITSATRFVSIYQNEWEFKTRTCEDKKRRCFRVK